MIEYEELPEEERRERLHEYVVDMFSYMSPEEVDGHCLNYPSTVTTMIEITHVHRLGCMAEGWDNGAHFEYIRFPESIAPLIRKHDVFLVTMGLDGDDWEVIYMSPPYEPVFVS